MYSWARTIGGLPGPSGIMALNQDGSNFRAHIAGGRTVLQRSRVPASALEYWQSTLAGAPPVLELPTDRPRPPVVSYAGGRVAVVMSSELTSALRALSRRHGTTLFMTLLAGWSILLSRLTRHSDIVIGTPVPNHGRDEIDPLGDDSPNLLALRVRLRPEQRVSDLLLDIRTSTLEAYAHQDVPLMEIVEALELTCDLSYHPIFQVVLAVDVGSAQHSNEMSEEQIKAKFDLTLALADNGTNLTGCLEYASDLFDRATIVHLADQLRAVFEALVADERQYLGAPELLAQHVETVNSNSAGNTAGSAAGGAAGSAALLAHIRQALERMGAIPDPLHAEEPVRLLMRLDGQSAVWHQLGPRTTIGRAAENDVRIDEGFISRRHAVVAREGDDTVIEDLGSTNGTYVNGERIGRRILRNGDLVNLGTLEFHFSVK